VLNRCLIKNYRLKLPRGSFRPGSTDQTVTEFRICPRAMLAKFLEQIITRVMCTSWSTRK